MRFTWRGSRPPRCLQLCSHSSSAEGCEVSGKGRVCCLSPTSVQALVLSSLRGPPSEGLDYPAHMEKCLSPGDLSSLGWQRRGRRSRDPSTRRTHPGEGGSVGTGGPAGLCLRVSWKQCPILHPKHSAHDLWQHPSPVAGAMAHFACPQPTFAGIRSMGLVYNVLFCQ